MKIISAKFKTVGAVISKRVKRIGNGGQQLWSKIKPKKKLNYPHIWHKIRPYTAILVILLAIIQVVFGVLIYGYHREDKITRAIATAVPYPAALTNYSVVSYADYLTEKDYIHHFYQQTQQENSGNKNRVKKPEGHHAPD